VVTGNCFVEFGLAQFQCRSCVIGAHAGSPLNPSHFFFWGGVR
jgi:hypothetical protein